ncbi:MULTISPECIES: hypothetical protein [Vagococcus]|uniref:hypothetical protein n=1 Tax=Vagococcus TaxID=2737 RepID=UPI000B36169E|nr:MULTISPECIES: hypothetical protein [Vagococcus]HCM88923.1 hypothetical protein [Vagococcus sp.]
MVNALPKERSIRLTVVEDTERLLAKYLEEIASDNSTVMDYFTLLTIKQYFSISRDSAKKEDSQCRHKSVVSLNEDMSPNGSY